MGWLAALVLAGAAQGAPIAIDTAIVQAVAGAGEHSGGYVRLRNDGAEADRLVDIACTCSTSSEIHSTREGGMVALPGLDIPAGTTVEIRPASGLHLMLEAAGPLAAGDTVELVLRFAHAGRIAVSAAIVADTFAAWPPEAD